jgi:hypothetical protein
VAKITIHVASDRKDEIKVEEKYLNSLRVFVVAVVVIIATEQKSLKLKDNIYQKFLTRCTCNA